MEWDNANRVALEKLRFYVTVRVDDMVTQGEEVTVREYYQRSQRLFLRTGVESVVLLGKDWRFENMLKERKFLNGSCG